MSNVVYTTPAAPSSVKVTRPSNDYLTVDITGPARWATSYEIQRSTDSGKSWTAAGSTASFPWNDTSAPESAVMYRVRATVSGLYSAWTQSNELVVGPPLAPTVTGIPNVVPTGTVITFSWTPNHPDGSPQTQAQVEFVFNGDTHTYDISGDTTTYSFDSGEQTGDLTVRVRTHGIDDEWGAWSQYYACGIYYPPSVLVTDPSSDTATVGYVPYVFKWNAVDDTGISSQKLEIFRDGQAVFSKTLDGAARELSIGLSDLPFENGAAYSVTVTASGGSGLSSSYTRQFSVDWIEPAVPEADVDTMTDGFYTFITVHEGTPTGDEPETATFTVARVIDGAEYVLEEGLTAGQQAIDRLPPLNVEFSYAVYAFASSGVYSRLDVPYTVDSGGMEAFNFGQDAGTAIVLGLDANGSESTEHSGEEYRFAMGPDTPMLPTFYPDGEISVNGSHSYITDYSQYRAIRGIVRDRRNAVLWFRSALGDRARCAASWKLGYDAKSYRLLDVSVDLTEVVWEDPSNG